MTRRQIPDDSYKLQYAAADEVWIQHYQTSDGRIPYRHWIESLRDKAVASAVLARIRRLAIGTFGDWKAIGEGVCELRVHLGGGYRVYFGRDGQSIVILLCGGAKRSQVGDIKRAKLYWRDYEARKNNAVGAPG